MVDQIDQKGKMASALERARIPVKPGEYAVISDAGTIALAAFVYGITGSWIFAIAAFVFGPLISAAVVKRPDLQAPASLRGAASRRSHPLRVLPHRRPYVPPGPPGVRREIQVLSAVGNSIAGA